MIKQIELIIPPEELLIKIIIKYLQQTSLVKI